MEQIAPRFRDPAFLDEHIRRTMAFYHPRCIDREQGGFFHYFRDDGSVYDADHRHLVSSTRFVFNYAMAFRRFGDPEHRDAARHGIAFLRGAHGSPPPAAMPGCSLATASSMAPIIATGLPLSSSPMPRRWRPALKRLASISKRHGS